MSDLLISFCNVSPPGLALGLHNFDTGAFRWIDLSPVGKGLLGVDGICTANGSHWILPQLAIGGVSGLTRLDEHLNVKFHAVLAETADAHSIAASGSGFLVTDTKRNRLNRVEVDAEAHSVRETACWRYGEEQTDSVHLNSVAELNGDIYVSLFGPKPAEGWASAAEGQILNTSTNQVVCDRLRHPHTLVNIDGALCWLESGTGQVHCWTPEAGHRVVFTLPGYVRGLAWDARHLYVAASALRRRSRSTGVMSIPPSAKAEDWHSWLYRVNRKTLAFERRKMTAFGSEIYDLAPVPSAERPKETGFGGITTRVRTWCARRLSEKESGAQSGMDAVITRLQAYEEEYTATRERREGLQFAVRDMARELVAGQQWEKAGDWIRRLLEVCPGEGEFEYLRAFCLHMQHKDLDVARQHYDLALEHGFHEFWVRYHRGQLLLALGDLNGARSDLTRAVELQPDNESARQLLHQAGEPSGPA